MNTQEIEIYIKKIIMIIIHSVYNKYAALMLTDVVERVSVLSSAIQENTDINDLFIPDHFAVK